MSDEVGALQQRGLALAHLARRVLERRQLVHAVVDDRARRQVAEQRQRHRRVEPDDVVVDPVVGQIAADQRLQRRQLIVVEAAGVDRRVRRAAPRRPGTASSLETGRAARVHRLLDDDDVEVAREAREQVLRPLEDEFPAQMGEDDEVWHGSLQMASGRSGGLAAASEGAGPHGTRQGACRARVPARRDRRRRARRGNA